MEIHGEPYEIEVRVTSSFKASHSLPTRPETHDHLWEVEFSVAGPINPATGMVCDMLDLTRFFRPYIKVLNKTNLHECPQFQEEPVRLTAIYPTCDTLAHYFLWKTIPVFKTIPLFSGLRISQVRVCVFEPEPRKLWGYAIIRPQDKKPAS